MVKNIKELKWNLYEYKSRQLLIWGLKNGYIRPYDDELIEKLRHVYYGGIPASIILLSDALSNGFCYDRTLLLAESFLQDEDDIKLVYATVDSIKLNPEFFDENDPLYADHCYLERTTKDGLELIYDISTGFIYTKKIYSLMEHQKVRKINNKEAIKEYIKLEEKYHPENIENDKYISPLVLPRLAKTYGRPNEMYSLLGIELLQREIEHFKKEINYDGICREIKEDMRKIRSKKK